MKIRYSDSHAPRGHHRRHSVAPFGRDAQFARWKRKMCAKPRDGVSFTVTTVIDNPPLPLSAARVTTPSSETHARKMGFRIAKLSINPYSVNSDQYRIWFQIPRKITLKLSFLREAPMVDVGCPCLVQYRSSALPQYHLTARRARNFRAVFPRISGLPHVIACCITGKLFTRTVRARVSKRTLLESHSRMTVYRPPKTRQSLYQSPVRTRIMFEAV